MLPAAVIDRVFVETKELIWATKGRNLVLFRATACGSMRDVVATREACLVT